MLAALVGAACWSQVPSGTAPVVPVERVVLAEEPPPPPPPRPDRAAVQIAVEPTTLPRPEPAVAPTALPVATPVPRAPGGDALLRQVRIDLEARWFKNHRETPFRGGPSDDAPLFNLLPQWSTVRQVEGRGDWLLVHYDGDGESRQPGPGWVRAEDLGPIATPVLWLATANRTGLHGGPGESDGRRLDLPPGTRAELVGRDPIQGRRLFVRLPGDGRSVPPAEGWLEAADVARVPPPALLPWAYPAVLGAEVRLPVPYRTQLDGSPYASANCGPSVLGMVLERYGVQAAPRALRAQVLRAQDSAWDDDAGSFIWAMATVAESHGLRVHGLYEGASPSPWTLDDARLVAGERPQGPAVGSPLRRWSVDDVRAELRQGRPVIAQVRYRALPRREESEYYGDHYVVLTGLLGDAFIYHDPIWGTGEREGPGFDRVMTAAELRRAMNASDRPYAYTAFSVSR